MVKINLFLKFVLKSEFHINKQGSSLHNLNQIVTVKVNFTLEQAQKAQRQSRGIVLLFPKPQCYIEVGGQCHVPAAIPLGKTWYP